ncbi:MAG: DUF1848 domain-containing protein, partial [Treponema sp.]|nr:DUF1848 domain-containing protein [Treponema sp.]
MIVSVSRRCDIPRFRFDWFLERLDEGFADVVNPFNAKQLRRVYFSGGESPAGAVQEGQSAASGPAFFVFWTRDPRSVFEHGPDLLRRGFRFYTMVTLTGYPAILESNPPPRSEVIAAIRAASVQTGTRGAGSVPPDGTHVIWRYDPILLSSVSDADYHRRNFAVLAAALEGAVSRVIFSVYDDYAGARRRFAALSRAERPGKQTGGPDGFALFPHYDDGGRVLPELRQLLGELAAAARRYGIVPQSCAEAENFDCLGVRPGACIDPGLIGAFCSGGPGLSGKAKNQRPHCLCAESVDIGTYGNCPAGCAYC